MGEGGGGGGYSDIFIHMSAQTIFRGFKILNSIFLWVFRKINIFGGMKKVLWIFGIITKLDYFFFFWRGWGHFYTL